MKTARRMAAQGDVLFRRIGKLPEGAKRIPHDGPLVVAHSETGHHHVIDSPEVEIYATADPLVSVLRIAAPFADVVHLRSFDTHETVRLLGNEDSPSFFEVRRQREHDFEKNWRTVND